MSAYDGLLLDHDGVLVAVCGKAVLHDATRDAFRNMGVPAPEEDAVAALAIRVEEAELEAVAAQYDVDATDLWEQREAQIAERLRAETTAGRKPAYDDVDVLSGIDLPLGIVSNNQQRIVEFVLEHHGLADLFETVHAREPTRASLRVKKPNPLFLEEAAAALECANPLYVGDSESDVIAGQRAGVDVAYLRRPHNRDRPLGTEPTYEVESLTAVADLI